MKIIASTIENLEIFQSRQGITMIRGTNMNWEMKDKYGWAPKEGLVTDNILQLYFDGQSIEKGMPADLIQAVYFLSDKILKLSNWRAPNVGALSFKVKNLEHAEELVFLCLKAYQGEIRPLYSKEYEV